MINALSVGMVIGGEQGDIEESCFHFARRGDFKMQKAPTEVEALCCVRNYCSMGRLCVQTSGQSSSFNSNFM
ncbi:MAG: hypothetical protein HamCj_13810 [Candidatus Hamiltonella defensa (Ceratovacuna japonica)]